MDEGKKMAALFGEIQSKDGNMTSNLKKVKDEEKVYKQEREAQAYNFDALYEKKAQAEERRKAKAAEQAEAAHAGAHKTAAGPPQFEQIGPRFMCKNIVGGPDDKQDRRKIEGVAVNHAVVIQSCEHFVVQIGGKFNSLALLNCENVAVGMESVVTTVDISNCKGVTIHLSGVCRCVVVDKSSEVQLIFTNEETARSVQVVTSMCSTVNVRFPNKDDKDELIERPIPEQFVSKIVPDGKGFFKLQTKAADN